MTLPIVIVGGGVAGVCCAQELLRLQRQPGASLFRDIILISSVPVVSTPINVVERSSLADFQLRSVPMSEFAACGVICIHGTVISIESNQHSLTIQRNESANIEHIAFHKLCICTGARPLTFQADESVLPRIITIRDSTSIETLKRQLERSRSVTIVGNGGIALELIYALCCQSAHHIQHVHWVLKDNHIGSAFFDEAAAAFLMPDFFPDRDPDLMCGSSTLPALSSNTVRSNQGVGGSLGPFWLGHVNDAIGPHRHIVNFNPAPSVVVPDTSSAAAVTKPQLTLHLNSSIHCLSQVGDSCKVQLTDGTDFLTDFVVPAIGVQPCLPFCGPEFARCADCGLLVNCSMETSVADVLAAGDCCTIHAPCCSKSDPSDPHLSPNWFQMRLWTQARVQGIYSAQCIISATDILTHAWPFRIFAHCTEFAGRKVVLLGRFRAECQVRMKVVPQQSFVKLLLHDGKLIGAVLIGDTDLEETCENLIMNELDLSQFGADALNDDVDLEDYFD